MYYKLTISITQDYTETNEFYDCGVISTKTASTIEELIKHINTTYNIKDAEMIDGNMYISYEGEQDYNTPKSEQSPYIETMIFSIDQVQTEQIDISQYLK